MSDRITATEASRSFLSLLKGVSEGQSFIITRYGRPVARMEPFTSEDAAKMRLLKTLHDVREPSLDQMEPGPNDGSTPEMWRQESVQKGDEDES